MSSSKKEKVVGECRLCEQVRELQGSHITPDFVYRWMRETAPTGKFRDAKVINRPIEDGERMPLLCGECEQIFCKHETQFSKKFFLPFHDEESTEFEYKEWLLRCGLSIIWRELVCRSPETIDLFPEVRQAERIWREFLLGQRANPGIYGLNVFALGLNVISGIEDRLFNFISRSNSGALCHSDIVFRSLGVTRTDENLVIVSKIGRIFLVGMIKVSDRKPWQKTQVRLKQGHFNSLDSVPLPPLLNQWISDQADKLAEAEANLSERQKAALERASLELQKLPKNPSDKTRRLPNGEVVLYERARVKKRSIVSDKQKSKTYQ